MKQKQGKDKWLSGGAKKPAKLSARKRAMISSVNANRNKKGMSSLTY